MASATNKRGAVATVRIAPVERWCKRRAEFLKEHPEVEKCVGMPVQILIHSMVESRTCDGRAWAILSDSVKRAAETMGYEGYGNNVTHACEHILEMD